MSSSQIISSTLHLRQWRGSPFSKKVRMALAFKGLPYRCSSVELRELGELRARTGLAKVPVLIDGDAWITDSTRILAHLEARWPAPSLFPAAPHRRTECALLEDWADEALSRTVEPLLWLSPGNRRILFAELREELPGPLTAVATRLFVPVLLRPFRAMVRIHGSLAHTRWLFEEQLDTLERRLSDGPFLFGEQPTAADFAVAAQLDAARRLDLARTIEARPNLTRMVEAATVGLAPPQERAA